MRPEKRKAMEIEAALRQHANPERARGMKAYMRDQFEYLGLQSTERRRLSRPHLQALPPARLKKAIHHLYALPEREFQYFAVELAAKSHRLWVPEQLALWKWMVGHKSWWDTVDCLSTKVVGVHMKKFGGDVDSWIDAPDFWLQRVALLYQLDYKKDTDPAKLFHHIDRVIDSQEFFLRKAIGWALRQYARIAPDEVRRFVQSRPQLSGLSRREALKHLQKEPA